MSQNCRGKQRYVFPSHEFVCLWFNCQILSQRIKFWYTSWCCWVLQLYTPVKMSASCQGKVFSLVPLWCEFEIWPLVCSYHKRPWNLTAYADFFIIRPTDAYLTFFFFLLLKNYLRKTAGSCPFRLLFSYV